MTDYISGKIAGFHYDGKEYALVPDEMRRINDTTFSASYEKGLKVTLAFNQVMPGTGEWLVRFENTGDEPTYQISGIKGLSMSIKADPDSTVLWQGLRGDYCNELSFLPIERQIPQGETFMYKCSYGRSSQEGFPYFDLTAGGRSYVFGIGWTGQWILEISRTNEGVNVKAGQEYCDFYLNPGESARSIRVIAMSGAGKADELRRKFRRMHREYYSPLTFIGKNIEIPLSIQVFDRYFYTLPLFRTEEGQIKCINAKCGPFNTYWLDAAWFKEGFPNGVGNYECAPGFPRGLKPISEAAHENNMKFMVWFEPERIHTGSDTYKNFGQKPGWILSANENEENKLFNLANTEARNWLIKKLITFIEENGIDIYRQDFNINPLEYWLKADGENRVGYTENKYIEGLYIMWDKLIAHFPGLLIDNCASGGRRIDFETNCRSVPLWRSDTGCFPDSEDRPVATWHQNQSVMLSRYLPYHAISTWLEKAYFFRSGATWGQACNFDILKDGYDTIPAQKATEEFMRISKYWDGDIYELMPVNCDEDKWFAWQLDCGINGVCMFFRRRGSEITEMKIPLKTIDAAKTYRVILTDEQYGKTVLTVLGEALSKGLPLSIPGKPGSLILEYEIQF